MFGFSNRKQNRDWRKMKQEDDTSRAKQAVLDDFAQRRAALELNRYGKELNRHEDRLHRAYCSFMLIKKKCDYNIYDQVDDLLFDLCGRNSEERKEELSIQQLVAPEIG